MNSPNPQPPIKKKGGKRKKYIYKKEKVEKAPRYLNLLDSLHHNVMAPKEYEGGKGRGREGSKR